VKFGEYKLEIVNFMHATFKLKYDFEAKVTILPQKIAKKGKKDKTKKIKK